MRAALLLLGLVTAITGYNVRDFETDPPIFSRNDRCPTGDGVMNEGTCLETVEHHISHRSEDGATFLEFHITGTYEPRRWRIFHLQNGVVGIADNSSSRKMDPVRNRSAAAVQATGTISLESTNGTEVLHVRDVSETLADILREEDIIQERRDGETKAVDRPSLLFVGRDRSDAMVSHKFVGVHRDRRFRQVREGRTLGNQDLVLDVERVHIQDVYRHAHVALHTNILPSINVYAPPPQSTNITPLSPSPHFIGCPFFAPQSLCNAASVVVNAATDVVHVASDVARAAVDVYHVAKDLATGSLSDQGSSNMIDIDVSLSGDASSSSFSGEPTFFHRPSIQVGGLTISANASFQVVLQYHFVISDYSIQNITAIIQSTLEAAVDGEFDEADASSYTKVFPLGTVKFDTITLDVGVPVVVSPSIPINAGASVMVKGYISGGVAAVMSGQLTTGLIYAQDTFQPVHELEIARSFTHHFEETITVGLNIWIMPTLILDTDYFGGPFFGLKVTAQLLLNEVSGAPSPSSDSLSASSSSSSSDDVALAVNVNLLIAGTLGAKLAFHHFGMNWSKTFGPATIVNYNIPLYQSTFQLGADGATPLVSKPLMALGHRLRSPSLSTLAQHRSTCPGPNFPLSSYIGQSLFGVLSVNPQNTHGIFAGLVTMSCIIVTSESTPFYPDAVAVHFSCTLSGGYFDYYGVEQYFSQQAACTLRDTSSGNVNFQISSIQQLQGIAFTNSTSPTSAPSFSFSFTGSPGDSCDVTEFVLTNDNLGSVTISGAPST